MNKPTLIVLIASASTCFAQQSAININFVAAYGEKGNATLAPNDSAGVQASPHWNNIQSGMNNNEVTSTSNLKNSQGTYTTTDISYPQNFWSMDKGSSLAGILSSGYINSFEGSNATLTLNQIDSEFTKNGYNLIVYLGGTDAQSPETAIEVGANVNGGTDKWIRHVRSKDGTVAKFNSETFSSEQLAEQSASNSNYILFTGLRDEKLTINILKDPDSEVQWHRAGVRGLQIIANDQITHSSNNENSSTALIGIGGITLKLKKSH